MDLGYEVSSTSGDRTYLVARSRMVQVNQGTGRSQPFDEAERTEFEQYLGEVPALRGW